MIQILKTTKIASVLWAFGSSFKIVLFISLIQVTNVAAGGNENRWQGTFSYWNDNIITSDLTDDLFEDGPDDYETANFRLMISKQHLDWTIFADSYLNILTNRSAGYRLDLLTIRGGASRTYPWGRFKAAVGVIAAGDFAGDNIQNSYHSVRGHDQVSLSYVNRGQFGVSLFAQAQPRLWVWQNIQLNAYFSNAYRSWAGPSLFRAGLETRITLPNWGSFHPSFDVQSGGNAYYNLSRYLRPLFDNGINGGGIVRVVHKAGWSFAVWSTINQYGVSSPQFGMTIGWGNEQPVPDLNDVAFP